MRVPDTVPLEAASLSAIGAIALQGFRQSQAVLGEVVAVIGAGLVGVLTMQLAKAAGCQVIAIDLDRERVESASKQFGADIVSPRPTGSDTVCDVRRNSPATALTLPSSLLLLRRAEPVELAAEISRERGASWSWARLISESPGSRCI